MTDDAEDVIEIGNVRLLSFASILFLLASLLNFLPLFFTKMLRTLQRKTSADT